MTSLVHISEARVRELLNWDETFKAVKCALESVSKSRAFQSARSITQLPRSQNSLYTMPGYLEDPKYGALGCKLVTYFPKNSNMPSVLANILLMDSETGELKAVIEGTEITTWRTAAASAVATKFLYSGDFQILGIIGAGTQGRIHAVAFQYFFKFKEVRIWNRSQEKTKTLVDELRQNHNSGRFVACSTPEECIMGADVIVTTVPTENPIVKCEWLKNGAHINAVGVGPNVQELDDETYKSSEVYVDCWDGAKNELTRIQKLEVEFKGQIGDVIVGSLPPPLNSERFTVFQSLGMAVEDCAMARLVYDLHNMDHSTENKVPIFM